MIWSCSPEARRPPLFVDPGPYYPAIDELPFASDLSRVPGGVGSAKDQVLHVFGKIPDFIGPRVVVAKQSPSDFPDLAARLWMEPDAVVCRFDQAFL